MSKMSIRRRWHSEVWTSEVSWWQDVQKTSGDVENLGLVRRDACLKKERTDGVIDGANNTLDFTILR
jgi:hypothetical protein